MLAFLVLLVAAAPPSAPAKLAVRSAPTSSVPADGRVVTPEGIRFRLPPRLSYSTRVEKGQRAWIAKSADETTLVVVSAFLAEIELPCRSGPEGVQFEAFETAGGLRGCIGSAQGDDSPLAFALALVKSGEVIVSVNAIAPSHAAEGLARSVADSVTVNTASGSASSLHRLKVPKVERAMVGCFEDSTAVSVGSAFSRTSMKRCFNEDFTFTEKFTSATSVPLENQDGDLEALTTGLGEDDPSRGLWSYDDGVLTLEYEDGGRAEWKITVGSGGLLANGRLWERL